MYNVTPHGTTGKTPSELLFDRNIQDKIPPIGDLTGEEKNEEAADNDILNTKERKRKIRQEERGKQISIQEIKW